MPIPVPHRVSLAVLCSLLVACAHPDRTPPNDGALAKQLVGWDLVRRRAEHNELAIRLPNIAMREHGFEPVMVPLVSPHFATVAMAWPMICERRGVLPIDVFDYAMAWCRYARDGQGDLERDLVGFMASRVPGLRAAAVDDLVIVVADAHDAATAMRVLAGVTPLANLAAIYLGLGREADAAVVQAQLPPLVIAAACSELDAALETFAPQSLITIRRVAAGSVDCTHIARAIMCRIDAVSDVTHDPVCKRSGASVLDGDREVREAHYLAAYARWGADWPVVIGHAVQAMPEPGAEQVAIAALVASLRSGCDLAARRAVREQTELLLREPAHDARWTPTLHLLATITPERCATL